MTEGGVCIDTRSGTLTLGVGAERLLGVVGNNMLADRCITAANYIQHHVG